MGRVKIKFPNQKALYQLSIPVRVSDINYGNHMGNDSLLSIIHEARMQLLRAWGFTELHAGGSALIMADVMIAYRSEAYYGDVLNINIYTEEIGERSFDLLYHITTMREGEAADVAHAKTGMVCYNYDIKKIVVMGAELRNKLLNDNM